VEEVASVAEREVNMDIPSFVAKARNLKERIEKIVPSGLSCANGGQGGGCIVSTFALRVVAFREGLKIWPQAGTLCWPFTDPEKDDGRRATHFSFVWDEKKSFSYTVGMLWEMHAWAAISPDVIIDLETGDFKRLENRLLGLPWTGKNPPDYLWGIPPEGAIYNSSESAIRFLGVLHGALMDEIRKNKKEARPLPVRK
jgi:hypothetical protein